MTTEVTYLPLHAERFISRKNQRIIQAQKTLSLLDTMSIPASAREYRLPEFKGIDSLTTKDAPVPKPKSDEVLVKVGAVSLNFRDLMIASGNYPAPCVFEIHSIQPMTLNSS